MKNYTIEKGFELVNLKGLKFKNNEGEIFTIINNVYGFRKNGLFVADVCKSAGGSTEPMAYNKTTAMLLIDSGFVKEELSYCSAV